MADIIENLDQNFKSTLPPRKRAKTKEEKEQRRVERILRNRRAAHASREKKRKHVEYLESYVVKLEDNLSKLQSNFDVVAGLLSKDQLSGINLHILDDLKELKEKIHMNLNSSASNSDSNDLSDHQSKKRKLSSSVGASNTAVTSNNEVKMESEEPELVTQPKQEQIPHFKKEEKNSNELLSVTNDNVYFNYLSPISINSPINSPIDLTLKKSDEEFTPLSLDDSSIASSSLPSESNNSLREFDLMGQNSEEILLPKSYGVENSSIISLSRF